MPAKSKAQFKFMKAAAQGDIKVPGLNPKQASEYVAGQSPKGLPQRVKPADNSGMKKLGGPTKIGKLK